MTKENEFTLQELELIATQMPLVSKNSDIVQKINAKIESLRSKTIRIGLFDVPEPLREAPEVGTRVFTPNLVNDDGYTDFNWDSDYTDNRMLCRGLIHKTKESAILHSSALSSLTERK